MQEKKSRRELMDEATELLRKAGYTANGAKSGTVKHQQRSFECRMVKTGFRGASRQNKKT